MEIEQALIQLKECLCSELSTNTTSVMIFINHQETKITTTNRTTDQLKANGIYMRNIQGGWIL